MTRKEFIKFFGEDPRDVLGKHWRSELTSLTKSGLEDSVKKYRHEEDDEDIGLPYDSNVLNDTTICK